MGKDAAVCLTEIVPVGKVTRYYMQMVLYSEYKDVSQKMHSVRCVL